MCICPGGVLFHYTRVLLIFRLILPVLKSNDAGVYLIQISIVYI